jgi:hypothetical protein
VRERAGARDTGRRQGQPRGTRNRTFMVVSINTATTTSPNFMENMAQLPKNTSAQGPPPGNLRPMYRPPPRNVAANRPPPARRLPLVKCP